MELFRGDKQIIKLDHNIVKNPNRQEVNQLAILGAWPRIWTWHYQEQIQLEVRTRLEPGASGLQVECSNHLAMLLRDEGPHVGWVCLKCQLFPPHNPRGRGRGGESQGVGGWEWGRKRVITGLSALGTTAEPLLTATSLQWPPFFLPVDKNLYIDSCLKPLYDGHLLLS